MKAWVGVSQWELIEGSTCASKAGDLKISGGFMQVWDDGSISFGFDGLTLDDRFKVDVILAPSKRKL